MATFVLESIFMIPVLCRFAYEYVSQDEVSGKGFPIIIKLSATVLLASLFTALSDMGSGYLLIRRCFSVRISNLVIGSASMPEPEIRYSPVSCRLKPNGTCRRGRIAILMSRPLPGRLWRVGSFVELAFDFIRPLTSSRSSSSSGMQPKPCGFSHLTIYHRH